MRELLSSVNLCRRPACHHATSLFSGAGPHVDHPVAARHDSHVVLDDDDGVAGVNEPIELCHKLFDVGRMQPCGRLIQDVQRIAPLRALELRGQLDSLCSPPDSSVAAGEAGGIRGRLRAGPSATQYLRVVREEVGGGVNREVQDLRDVPAAVLHLERPGLKRVPWQAGHGAYTLGGRGAHHHEPFTLATLAAALRELKENRPAS